MTTTLYVQCPTCGDPGPHQSLDSSEHIERVLCVRPGCEMVFELDVLPAPVTQ